MKPERGNAGLFASIDWSRPWLAPFRALAVQILQEPDWCAALNQRAAAIGLRNHRGLPIQFVPQASLPPGTAYEAFISATGCVPTRENLHDFFNALVWLSFPKIKVQLNALHAEEIERASGAFQGIQGQGRRGQLRDAATIFDENAALLVLRDASLIGDFRAHRWQEVFITRRSAFERDWQVLLFGHAVMEKLVTPYKAITAHAWPVIASESFFCVELGDKRAWLDITVARQIENGLLTSLFTPLPVLGIPEWCRDQDVVFYADTNVFRPKRQAK